MVHNATMMADCGWFIGHLPASLIVPCHHARSGKSAWCLPGSCLYLWACRHYCSRRNGWGQAVTHGPQEPAIETDHETCHWLFGCLHLITVSPVSWFFCWLLKKIGLDLVGLFRIMHFFKCISKCSWVKPPLYSKWAENRRQDLHVLSFGCHSLHLNSLPCHPKRMCRRGRIVWCLIALSRSDTVKVEDVRISVVHWYYPLWILFFDWYYHGYYPFLTPLSLVNTIKHDKTYYQW